MWRRQVGSPVVVDRGKSGVVRNDLEYHRTLARGRESDGIGFPTVGVQALNNRSAAENCP
jgi:hypothetical protein